MMVRRRFLVALAATMIGATAWAFGGPGEITAEPLPDIEFAGPTLDEAKVSYIMVMIYPGGSLVARIKAEDARRNYPGKDDGIDEPRLARAMRSWLIQGYSARLKERSKALVTRVSA